MVILRRTILPAKMVLVELEATLPMGLKIRCFGASSAGSQGTQIETCVEIVLPSLRGRLPVGPRTVLVLLAHREAHCLQRRPQPCLVSRFFGHPAQKSGPQEIRVVDFGSAQRRVVEARDRIAVRPIEYVPDELRCADSDAEITRLPGNFIDIEQRIGGKRRADDVGQTSRNQSDPRLPWAIVTPAQ